ncbi:hypothetical protein HII36_47680 [Nonomuraea sp. NN258]|uniref:hypothetical protein n=1 Tax=Nonomuraea antri TaxID=2730852 RepID=UPI001568930F|nr:hypothetical protein [Nonomuraea antri]NRQ39458.1 hypothetical protein [Nonomuraea antri]
MVLITVRLGPAAGLADAMAALGLDEQDVDPDYGLIAVDPESGLYALRVTPEAAARAGPEAGGPYADPPIEPHEGPGSE